MYEKKYFQKFGAKSGVEKIGPDKADKRICKITRYD
jgi:hypothetical protein